MPRRQVMPMNKPHLEFHKLDMDKGWVTPPGYPAGIQQKILASDLDETKKMGGRTRLLRFAPGVYTTAPFVHDHWEEVYLVSGDLIVGNDDKGQRRRAVRGADLCLPSAGRPSRAVQVRARLLALRNSLLRREQEITSTGAECAKRYRANKARPAAVSRGGEEFCLRRADAAAIPRTRRSNCSISGSRGLALSFAPISGGARGRGAIDRALARRQAAVADRRHADRHQGHHRDLRYADRNGLAAVCRLALGERRRQCARAARRRRGHSRQDGDDGVRGVRAARHAQSLEYGAHAGRLVERFGGVGRRRHRQRRARHAGDRLDHPAGELLRLFRLQAERERAQPRRLPRLSEPELHRHSRRLARRRVAGGA